MKNYRILEKELGENTKIILTYKRYKELGLNIKNITGINFQSDTKTYFLYDIALSKVDKNNVSIEKINQ